MITLLFLLLFSTFALASDGDTKKNYDENADKQQSLSYRIMTDNVCYPVDIFQNPTIFAKFAWSKRKDRIFKQIIDERPDIIGFQETRNEKGRSIVAEMFEGLGQHGYDFTHFKTSPHESAWINIIGYNTKRLALDKTHRWWVSETPDKFSDSWGNGWGRVALMATLYPIVVTTLKDKELPLPDYTKPPIHAVNVHHGLRHLERMHANRLLTEQIKEHAGKTGGIAVITGDFNDFDEYGGAEERQVLKDNGFTDALNDLRTAEGIKVSGTTTVYSYDTFQPPKGKLGQQIDHIYVKSLSAGLAYKSTSHVNLKKYDGKDADRKATCEAELLLNAEGVESRDEFCSDHAAGIVDLEIFTTTK